jgi:ribonuclease HI
LVINQMKGIYKVKNRELWPLHNHIKNLANKFEEINFQHVPREFNKLADAAVNRALDDELNK